MRGKINKLLIAPLIAMFLASMIVALPSQGQGNAVLSVGNVFDTTLTSGSSFSVEISVADVIDLYGLEFKLAFDPSLLLGLGVTPGSFWPSGVAEWINVIDPSGFVWYSITQPMGFPAGVSGSGVVAVVDFLVIAPTLEPGVYDIGPLYDVLAGNRFAIPILMDLESGGFANEADITVNLRTAYVGVRHVTPPDPQTINAQIMNKGAGRTTAKVQYAITDELGNPMETLTSAPVVLTPADNTKATSVSWSGYSPMSKYSVTVTVLYRSPLGGWAVGLKGTDQSHWDSMTLNFVVSA